jgi:NAD(P)-dependent dehydrogenase (short-subunit alcohol dehydrogenase family)
MARWDLGAGLEGRVVMVTGAAQGIGGATADAFAAAGALVFAIDQNGPGVKATVARMAEPTRHRAVEYDLRNISGIRGLVDQAQQELGPPWALANVHAVLRRKPLEEVTEEDWDLQLDVNLKAGFFLNRAVAEVMIPEKRGGRLINFSSAGFLKGALGGSHVYVASKGGVVSMTRALARAYGAHAITVNTVVPGQIDTPMQHTDNPPEVIAEVTRSSVLGRMGRAEEVASVVLFLASQHSSFITGAAINVSGGSILY